MKNQVARLKAIPGSVTSQSPMTDPANDPAWELVRFALNTRYEDLPAPVVDYAKKLVLDTLGIAVGGSSTETIAELVELVKGWGGKEESTILVYGGKVPAPNAAFVLGPMTRSLDMGDVYEPGGHLSEHIVPALLATSGLRGSVSGKELITAYAVAAEVGARAGNATFSSSGTSHNPTDSDLWSGRSPNLADLGSVLGVARLLNLDEKTAYNALSIQCWVVGAHSSDMPGNLMMRYQHAFLSQSAVNAVLLAQRGVNGPPNIFAGPKGYLATVYPWRNDISLLTKDLGKNWNFTNTSMKAYTGCFFNQGPVTAMDELRRGYAIEPRDIASIEVTQSAVAYHDVSAKEQCWNPQNMAQAQFSMPYTLATMAIYGKVFVDDFTPESRARADVRELMTRIRVKADEELPTFGGIVKVTLEDGTEYTKRVESPRGNPAINPMTWDDVTHKFKLCMTLSAKLIPDTNAEQVIQMVRNLEQCEDITKIIELLAP